MFQGLSFRAPLDNIHPLVDNNKNIQAALCHGSRTTSLLEERKSLDIATKHTNKYKISQVLDIATKHTNKYKISQVLDIATKHTNKYKISQVLDIYSN